MANLSWISSNPDYINQMIRNTQVTLSNNYNDLDNIPIIKITSTTNNPQKIWELKEGLYMIDGVVQVDNNTSYEVSNLLISMTARLENGKYILSAFIPYLRGLFEYILKTNSTEYEQHQKIVLMIKNDTLALDNETNYTPIEDYHPATKKYVDDKANEIVAELDRMGVNKENLESLNKENRIRDIKLQALLSETSDRNITIEENVRYFDMPLSIDNGIVTINEIVGETLVNVCDQEESVAITKSYTIENENHIALQGEYDGSCRPVVHGNTLVNHNTDWNGKVQTGIETSASGIEDVQVEGIKGQEVSVVVEGNTVLNHALGKTSAVVSNIESNLFNGNTYHGSISSLPVKPLTTYTVIATCLLNEATSENIGQFNYCFFSNETTHYNHESLAYYSGVQVGEQVITTIVTDENCKYIGVYDTNTNFIMRDILILEGDHTTNPKYVNSNEGNYVDLTVANDMSSVVEIEGGTMVNVCDQKDPIAVTKSYTVENSGNHIALQGEYDGSCRPAIQGNTMVNLFKKTLSFSTALSCNDILTMNSDTNAHRDGYSEKYRIKRFECYYPLKTSTTYTLCYSIIENNNNYIKTILEFDDGTTIENRDIIPYLDLSSNRIIFTTPSDKNAIKVWMFIDSDVEEVKESKITNIMLFEGDLTQTPELIPTEYVEGLKSSFEDRYIPSENLWNINELLKADVGEATTITDNSIKMNYPNSWTKVGLKLDNTLNKTYTLATKIEGNPRVYYRTAHELSATGETIIIEDNINKFYLKKIQFNTDNSLICFEGASNSVVNYNNIVILEGDWTHLTEEDFNNLGKYKVEYKVTGKNKFDKDDIRYVGQIYSDAGLLYNNENYNVGGYIECNKKQYILSGTTADGSNYNGDYIIEFNENKEFIKRTYMTNGLINLSDTTKYISVCPYITSKNIQIEEGSTATEYEPYKSYTKTFYLNSPLLEGDTIENVNGVATHVKRYGMVVLDGSSDEGWTSTYKENSVGVKYFQSSLNFPIGVSNSLPYCDKLQTLRGNQSSLTTSGQFIINQNKEYSDSCYVSTNLTTYADFSNWLQANPTTVVYQLASPIYETISTESILCDSYVNGHLDFDSAVPIEKVEFRRPLLTLKYLKENTKYTIQFKSDNIGTSRIAIGGDLVYIGGSAQLDIAKGINKFEVDYTTGTNIALYFNGIGFNASNIVVTEAIDADFDYFEGLKSSYECEVTEDGKYKVDVKVTGKNLFDGVLPEKIDTWSLSCYIRKGTYRFSANLSGFNDGTRLVIAFTDKDDKVITNTRIGYNTILDRDCYKMHFYSNDYSYSQSVNNFINISNFQIEEGTVATSYEPYFESTKTFYLNSPLLEGDKIVTKNGKIYHYHKMGKVVLDGSRTWWGSSNINGITFMATTSLFNLGTSDRKMLCDSLRVNQGFNQDSLTDYNEILAHKSSAYSNACYISTQLSQSDFINWLKSNPITVVYELDTPYYELIDEYNNTILNIPKNVAHLTHTSAVPVNNTTFTNYKDELNVLEANTQYRLMFDCDTANVPFTVTLGGTSQNVTSIKGTHSLLITTPNELVDKNLVIDGIGRCGIDNIRIFKGNVEYDYVKGLWSGYEERKLVNLCPAVVGGYEAAVSPTQTRIVPRFDKTLDNVCNEASHCIIIKNEYISREFTVVSNGDLMIESLSYINNQPKWIRVLTYHSYGCAKIQLTPLETLISFGTREGYAADNITDLKILVLEGDWTDNPPTYEEVMANEGKYAVKVKLDTNANIFGKGGRL